MGRSNEVGAIPYDKSNNIETSLFLKQGRITRKDFFVRTFVCIVLWVLVHLSFVYLETPNYESWVERGGGKIQSGAVQVEMRHNIAKHIDYYILPSLLMLFVIIQGAKRVHDCNRSSKWLLVPFYNIYLLLSEGSVNDNDYGLLPHAEVKSPSYKPDTSNSANPKGTEKKKRVFKWEDIFAYIVIGFFIICVLLNFIAPWFVSTMSIWLKMAVVISTCLGAYFVNYALSDNHKGKSVLFLGWCGAIVILLSTVLTIYGISGGFMSDTEVEVLPTHVVNDNLGFTEIRSSYPKQVLETHIQEKPRNNTTTENTLAEVKLKPQSNSNLNPINVLSKNKLVVTEKKAKSDVGNQQPEVKTMPKMERFQKAKRINDWKSMKELADEGYSPAYIPLARHYMNNPNQHSLAHKYALMAKRAGIKEADNILNELEELDF